MSTDWRPGDASLRKGCSQKKCESYWQTPEPTWSSLGRADSPGPVNFKLKLQIFRDIQMQPTGQFLAANVRQLELTEFSRLFGGSCTPTVFELHSAHPQNISNSLARPLVSPFISVIDKAWHSVTARLQIPQRQQKHCFQSMCSLACCKHRSYTMPTDSPYVNVHRGGSCTKQIGLIPAISFSITTSLQKTQRKVKVLNLYVYTIYIYIYGAQSGPTSQPWPLCFGLFRFVLEAVKHHLVT